MSIFLGVHKIPAEMTIDDVTKGYQGYEEAASSMGLKPIGAVASIEKSVAYCQTEAESKEQVEEAHQKAGVPLEEVIEVQSL